MSAGGETECGECGKQHYAHYAEYEIKAEIFHFFN